MRKALSPVAAVGAEVKKSEVFGVVKRIGSEYGLLISLVIIMVFFQVSTSGVLMQPLNLTNLVLQNSYIVIMALGMLMVIVSGHIDLSVGSTAGLVGALAAVLMQGPPLLKKCELDGAFNLQLLLVFHAEFVQAFRFSPGQFFWP